MIYPETQEFKIVPQDGDEQSRGAEQDSACLFVFILFPFSQSWRCARFGVGSEVFGQLFGKLFLLFGIP